MKNADHKYEIKHWNPPPIGWVKCNTIASKLEAGHIIMISYACKDNTCRVQYSSKNIIGGYPILLAETFAIGEAISVVV